MTGRDTLGHIFLVSDIHARTHMNTRNRKKRPNASRLPWGCGDWGAWVTWDGSLLEGLHRSTSNRVDALVTRDGDGLSAEG